MVSAAVILILVATPALAAVSHLTKINKTVSHQDLQHEKVSLVTLPIFLYKQDCWKKRPVAMTQLAAQVYKLQVPGAGMDPESDKAFGTVMKDGFYEVACVKDYMYSHGDAKGGNKHEYEIGSSSNVSIVHYSMMVPKEDQEAMTSKVCFEFCRTVPDMLFFGLTAGRECYCEPFFKPMAGDSTKCDAVCEGAPTTMCGGMAKSSVFEMHFCDDTAGDLSSAGEKAASFVAKCEDVAKGITADADSMQDSADADQKAFGSAGDPVASDLMQTAKVLAGELEKDIKAGMPIVMQLDDAGKKAEGLKGPFTSPAAMEEAEDTIKKVEGLLTDLEGRLEKVMNLHELARGAEYSEDEKGGPMLKETEGEPLKQYSPIMYFIDREFEEMPSTCGGDTLKKPILASDAQDCAAACDAEGIACAGFSYFELDGQKSKLCFMFSKFKSVQYYTECAGGKKSFLQKPLSFLQVPSQAVKANATLSKSDPGTAAPAGTMCYAKFASFTGTTLKPDPSGKCKLCLKTAEKAQRCFQ